jgi:hypothetical protein
VADMAFLMLAKCAEAQAIRNGWPEDLSNTFVDALRPVDRPRTLTSALQRGRSGFPAQHKDPRRLTPALPFDKNKPANRRINFHRKHPRPPLRIKVRKGSAQKSPGFIPARSRKMPPLRGLLLHRRVYTTIGNVDFVVIQPHPRNRDQSLVYLRLNLGFGKNEWRLTAHWRHSGGLSECPLPCADLGIFAIRAATTARWRSLAPGKGSAARK